MATQFDFSTPDISQSDIQTFAEEKVNLPREHADKYRAQVRNLRDNLQTYIGDHPDVGLKKMLLSGSLAKGLALKTLNDIDVGLYVASDKAPQKLPELLGWLVERLRTTYHQIPAERIYVDDPCVVISFKGTGLDVEIAPILYTGDADWRGYLWTRYGSEPILTSIPLHLEFTKKRKDAQPGAYAQTIRLLKWWANERERDTSNFEIKSFLIELIAAKVAANGVQFADFYTGLEQVLLYIQRSALQERIAFSDNYSLSKLPSRGSAPIEIFDPVNPENNVADRLTENNRRAIVAASAEALDALSFAKSSQTKQEALACWKDVMGQSFNA